MATEKTGRKSKLTDAKWLEVARRRLSGETTRDLAEEYGVSASQVSAQTKIRAETIKTLSNQIFEAQIALKKLPVAAQKEVNQHVANLLVMANELGAAGLAGAKTSRRIHEAVHKRVSMLDDGQLLSEDELKTVAQASTASNLSGKLAADMLNLASKPSTINATDIHQIKRAEDFTDDELASIISSSR